MKSNDHNLYSRTFGNHYFLIAVSLSLVFVFMGILLDRIDREFNRAEEIQFEYRIVELKAAVRLMEAALVSQGELQLADKFEGANPMDWLEDNTSHYVGVMSPDKALAYPGNWFFDPVNKEIAYVLTEQREADHQYESTNILRFKVRALRSKETTSKVKGLVLSEVQAIMQSEANVQK
tara:strand:+ start:6497 stop:7030 length:534 start_codon:yes stop_codon:yes gene_type:complete